MAARTTGLTTGAISSNMSKIGRLLTELGDGSLYVFIQRHSPKRNDLLRDGRYAIHSFPYPLSEDYTDEEFYLTGQASLLADPLIRQAVADACGDPVESGDVFELGLERALHKGRNNGVVVYTRWKAG